MAAGDIARAMGARQNTLSSNQRILSSAGLVSARREGRSIIYSASYGGIDDLLNYLVEDCCGAAEGYFEGSRPAASGLAPPPSALALATPPVENRPQIRLKRVLLALRRINIS